MAIVGSTTLKKQLKHRGVEPDESYYVQNEPLVRGRTDLELGKDPPPDLAIEIQLTQSGLNKLGIFAAMGVPEVWLWEEDRLGIFWLQAPGSGETLEYVKHDRSRALPGLPFHDLLRFLRELKTKSIIRIANEFRAWVRERSEHDHGIHG